MDPGGLWSSMAVLRLWSHHRDGHSAPEQRCGIGMVYILLEILVNLRCAETRGDFDHEESGRHILDDWNLLKLWNSYILSKKLYSQLTCFAPSTLRLFGWCAGRRLFRWGSFVTHVAGRCFLELLSRLCSQQKNTEQWRKRCLFLEEIFTVYMYK